MSTFQEIRRPLTIMIQPAKREAAPLAMQRRSGAVAQWRAILKNIKSDLEELGSALEYLIRLTFFIKGPFPNGGVLSSPKSCLDVMDEFFA